MTEYSDNLIGHWDGDPEHGRSYGAHSLVRLEFHADGVLHYVIPRLDQDDVMSFRFSASENYIRTCSDRTGREASFPYQLVGRDRLSLDLNYELTHWSRGPRPPIRTRRYLSQPRETAPDPRLVAPDGESDTWHRHLRQELRDSEDRHCAARRITRDQLLRERQLWFILDDSHYPFEPFAVDEFRETLERGADPNRHGNEGETLIMMLAKRGLTEAVDLLIRHGADVNAGDMYGWTPLIHAVSRGHIEAASLLIAAGANVTARRVDWYDRETEIRRTDVSVLEMARQRGDNAMITLLERTASKGRQVEPPSPKPPN